MTSLYVVCYDIIDDRLRARISKKMLDYGTRIQDSVFECLLDAAGKARLVRQIEEFPLADEDKIRLYRICAKCVEEVCIYGAGSLTRDPDFYLV